MYKYYSNQQRILTIDTLKSQSEELNGVETGCKLQTKCGHDIEFYLMEIIINAN